MPTAPFKMNFKKTDRGFGCYEFDDRYERSCTLQKSSLATEDCIWLGIDDAEPMIMAKDAHKLGLWCETNVGWIPFHVPPEVMMHTRMHLTRDQALVLAQKLTDFAMTGEVTPR